VEDRPTPSSRWVTTSGTGRRTAHPYRCPLPHGPPNCAPPLIDPAPAWRRPGPSMPRRSRYLTRRARTATVIACRFLMAAGRLWSAVLLLDRRTAAGSNRPANPLGKRRRRRPCLTLAWRCRRLDGERGGADACELGVDRLPLPLLAERGTGGIQGGRRNAWTAILREASEQCERCAARKPGRGACRPRSGWRSLAGLALIATSRRQELPRLCELLAQWADSPQRAAAPGRKLAIGPRKGVGRHEMKRSGANLRRLAGVTWVRASLRNVHRSVAGLGRSRVESAAGAAEFSR